QDRLRELNDQYTASLALEAVMAAQAEEPVATQVTIRNHGQIRSMVLPVGWIEERREEGDIGAQSVWSFQPENSPDVRICFFYRGWHVSREAGQLFHDILQLRPHWLTSSQIASLAEIIRDKKDEDAFQALLFQTNDFNGKNVLLVEGRYK